ncbi:MAG: hypothetical protein AB4352_22170 [Hormoscilla sp.]
MRNVCIAVPQPHGDGNADAIDGWRHAGSPLQHEQNYLKMRRRALPQGAPCGVEESDLEIYLTRSYALARLFPLLDPSEALLAQSGPGIPGFAWAFSKPPSTFIMNIV